MVARGGTVMFLFLSVPDPMTVRGCPHQSPCLNTRERGQGAALALGLQVSHAPEWRGPWLEKESVNPNVSAASRQREG